MLHSISDFTSANAAPNLSENMNSLRLGELADKSSAFARAN